MRALTSAASRSRSGPALIGGVAFLLAGVLGAVIWRLVVDLPTYVRTADNGNMDAVELSTSVAIDGWYVVIGAVLATLLGIGLMTWLSRRPRTVVLVAAVGGLAAGWLMSWLGELLGPGPVEPRLSAARIGEHVAVQLVPNTPALFLVWPLAGLAGVLLVLLFGRPATESF